MQIALWSAIIRSDRSEFLLAAPRSVRCLLRLRADHLDLHRGITRRRPKAASSDVEASAIIASCSGDRSSLSRYRRCALKATQMRGLSPPYMRTLCCR
jgi:hypothetical protein